MTIIPAHNEEKVIVNLIESLKNQDYPKELYDMEQAIKKEKKYLKQDVVISTIGFLAT